MPVRQNLRFTTELFFTNHIQLAGDYPIIQYTSDPNRSDCLAQPGQLARSKQTNKIKVRQRPRPKPTSCKKQRCIKSRSRPRVANLGFIDPARASDALYTRSCLANSFYRTLASCLLPVIHYNLAVSLLQPPPSSLSPSSPSYALAPAPPPTATTATANTSPSKSSTRETTRA